jgi:hypothetical protein
MVTICAKCGRKQKFFEPINFRLTKDNVFLCDECYLKDLRYKETEKQEEIKNQAEKNGEEASPIVLAKKDENEILVEIYQKNLEMNQSLSSIKGMITFFFVIYIIGLIVAIIYGFVIAFM